MPSKIDQENEMPEADRWLHNYQIHAQHWEQKETDLPNHINGFNGTFQIKDHSLIPQSLLDYIMERFPKKEKVTDIDLGEINRVLNEVWEGPGSMKKVALETGRNKYYKITGIWVEDFDTTTEVE